MRYQESPDALRARIEQVERELAEAREDQTGIPAREHELAELRRRLAAIEPRRRWPLAAIGAVLASLIAGYALMPERKAPVTETKGPLAPPVPANLRVTPEIAACLAKLPRAPDFHVFNDFASASGDLNVVWTLTPISAPPQQGDGRGNDLRVQLSLESGSISRTVALGDYPGHPYASDISICRGVSPGDHQCHHDTAEVSGVISEVSVQDWFAYAFQAAKLWMLVRTNESALLLRTPGASSWLPARADDRKLCDPEAWQIAIEIPLPTTVRTKEKVLHGDPPKPIDCKELGDARCTG